MADTLTGMSSVDREDPAAGRKARTVVRHSRTPPHGRRALRGVAAGLAFVMSFAGAGLALGYSRLQGNIKQHDITEYLGEDRPTPKPAIPGAVPGPTGPLNILVLASDSRDGDNVEIDGSGTSEGMRSDTTMIVHVSADRSRVDAVSIPRDTLVDIPSCRLPDGTSTAPQSQAMFNSAFSIGGASGDVGAAAACSIKTVEALTGVYIDDFVVTDFTGFIRVVDALGGIAMYIPEDIDDWRADLKLTAGCRLLDGRQALGLARTRYASGDGSDISRIGRQQDIVMEIIEDALQSNLLGDPIRLYQVLDASTQTLTTSNGFGNIPRMMGLANSLTQVESEHVTLSTMPFDYAGPRVVPNEAYAPYVWEALREDTPFDPAISGVGWEIAQAGIPPWTLGSASSPAESPETSDDADVDASGGNSPIDQGSPVELQIAQQVSHTSGITPLEQVDPAENCTKENAT